jgi:hypothetical protein
MNVKNTFFLVPFNFVPDSLEKFDFNMTMLKSHEFTNNQDIVVVN